MNTLEQAEDFIQNSQDVTAQVRQGMGNHVPDVPPRNKKFKITISGLQDLPDHKQLRSNIIAILLAFDGHYIQVLARTVTAQFSEEKSCKQAVVYLHGRCIGGTQISALFSEILENIDSELDELDELAIGEKHE